METGGSAASPLAPFLERQGFVVLDGGLATELESRGHDLDDPLWSARVLLDDPDSVRAVHRDYLRAGADVVATATYQASFGGFARRGLGAGETVETLRRAVDLAREARDAFWADESHRSGRLRPLVAASVGPYGAVLADGSEYRGDYGLSTPELVEFHGERWQVLAAAGADLMACETIPSAPEARALLQLLARSDAGTWAWISFSCRDGGHLADGTPLEEVARLCDSADRLAAIGVNCTRPAYVAPLIAAVRRGSAKPVLVYPNAGEDYDPVSKRWVGATGEAWWHDAPARWRVAGAAGVGGCCRIGPDEITAIRRGLSLVS